MKSFRVLTIHFSACFIFFHMGLAYLFQKLNTIKKNVGRSWSQTMFHDYLRDAVVKETDLHLFPENGK